MIIHTSFLYKKKPTEVKITDSLKKPTYINDLYKFKANIYVNNQTKKYAQIYQSNFLTRALLIILYILQIRRRGAEPIANLKPTSSDKRISDAYVFILTPTTIVITYFVALLYYIRKFMPEGRSFTARWSRKVVLNIRPLDRTVNPTNCTLLRRQKIK